MKKQEINHKKSFLKKIFVKICRILDFEIIDQNNFFVPTLNKNLNENLNIPGKKSITVPLGEIKVTRKVKALNIIYRSCTNVNMLTQNKKRLFDKNKSEYTFRSLNSILKSLVKSKKIFPSIDFEITVIDFNSKKEDLDQIKKQLSNSNVKNSLISLNVNEFKNNIKKINAKKQQVTENQMSNMSNIHKSLIIAKNESKDLIYFVEDDYIHQSDAIQEMIFTYERLSSQFDKELFLCPADYPYLYTKAEPTNIFIGSNKHWRIVNETLCTFLTSKEIIERYWEKLVSMCQFEHYPFEHPLHEIYKTEKCLSPIPSLAIHFTNINSIFGLSPNIDWKKIWEENENY
mgnify:FL=1|tara:strand:+ start:4231 stop:5265 length:1035 start_codon:yes stop_codon:yes gene_type:complete